MAGLGILRNIPFKELRHIMIKTMKYFLLTMILLSNFANHTVFARDNALDDYMSSSDPSKTCSHVLWSAAKNAGSLATQVISLPLRVVYKYPMQTIMLATAYLLPLALGETTSSIDMCPSSHGVALYTAWSCSAFNTPAFFDLTPKSEMDDDWIRMSSSDSRRRTLDPDQIRSGRTSGKQRKRTIPTKLTPAEKNLAKTLGIEKLGASSIKTITKTYTKTQTFENDPIADGASTAEPGSARVDHGYAFPPAPLFAKTLLESCLAAPAPASSAKHIITGKPTSFGAFLDVGSGLGYDSTLVIATGQFYSVALDIYPAQIRSMEARVAEILDPALRDRFHGQRMNILGQIPTHWSGQISVLNANRLLHFFNRGQTTEFWMRAHRLLMPGGRVIITSMAPASGSEIETVFNANVINGGSGEIASDLIMDLSGTPLAENNVRRPEAASMRPGYSRERLTHGETRITTTRVFHYHTAATLERFMNPESNPDRFRMINSYTHIAGGDSMVTVVAERQ
jgi:SAM-dependent methyltransferase